MLATVVFFLVCPPLVGAALAAIKPYPECTLRDKIPRESAPVLTNVTGFFSNRTVRHRTVLFTSTAEIGLILRDDVHELGEVVTAVAPGSQASDAGVLPGWIIKTVDPPPTNKSARLQDVVKNFVDARQADATLMMHFDVRAMYDCLHGDCAHSDRFPTDSADNCASCCYNAVGCEWWFLHKEDADTMCNLAKNVRGFVDVNGAVSGMHDCALEAVVVPSDSGWARIFLICGFVAVAAWISRERLVQEFPVLNHLQRLTPRAAETKRTEPGELQSLMTSALAAHKQRDTDIDEDCWDWGADA